MALAPSPDPADRSRYLTEMRQFFDAAIELFTAPRQSGSPIRAGTAIRALEAAFAPSWVDDPSEEIGAMIQRLGATAFACGLYAVAARAQELGEDGFQATFPSLLDQIDALYAKLVEAIS